MGIFKKIFGLSKDNNIKENTEVITNNTVVNMNTEVNQQEYKVEKIDNDKNNILEEQKEYIYPNINLIENDTIRNAIEKIEKNNGINVPIGLDENNKWIYLDITKLPNLLIGGTVMSGKTNFINMILLSIISRYSIEEVRLVIGDSKLVDYSFYNGNAHLLTPVIHDSKKFNICLNNIIKEMENRYELFERNGNKNITTYNDRIKRENESLPDNEKKKLMPYIVVIIDDYVSFSKNFENEYNNTIEKLAQFGWGAGIHLIIVANHPSSKILSSLSLVNFPSRLSFKVPSSKDSRMILNVDGAEKIYGIGNALLNTQLLEEISKVTTVLVDDEDIKSIIEDIYKYNKAHYDESLTMDEEDLRFNVGDGLTEEPLFNEIVEFVIEQGKASTSLIQRRFRLGYNRAAHAIDLLEQCGIIGPQNGSKPREVLAKYADK